MVHGRQWGVQHDILKKMTHVTTEEEMKERTSETQQKSLAKMDKENY